MASTPPVSRARKSFLAVAAAPRKDPNARQEARIARLAAQIQELLTENGGLKEHLSKLEARLDSMVDLTTDKMKEVQTTVTETHLMTVAKVKRCVTMELHERRLQDENALKVRIGGLPPTWEAVEVDFTERINFLNETLKPVKFDCYSPYNMASSKRAPLLAFSVLLLVAFLAAAPALDAQTCPCGFPEITENYDTTKYECCVYGADTKCTLLCNRGCCP
ncbi:hypothetical protein L7F22_061423 [Adiantum nelumboides]|nr:hypothetical protein [Adiantum nelumboides]